jgi:hypothetical protein
VRMQNEDLVQKFHALRSALSSERKALQKRLQQIDQAVGGEIPVPFERKAGPSAVSRRSRPRNSMSLREAVAQVLNSTPISRQELLAKLERAGYRFATSNPLNSLQTFLYGSGKKFVKNVDGNFAAVGSTPSTVGSKATSKPAKKRRRMSAQGRANIVAAQKARWAKQNAK